MLFCEQLYDEELNERVHIIVILEVGQLAVLADLVLQASDAWSVRSHVELGVHSLEDLLGGREDGALPSAISTHLNLALVRITHTGVGLGHVAAEGARLLELLGTDGALDRRRVI